MGLFAYFSRTWQAVGSSSSAEFEIGVLPDEDSHPHHVLLQEVTK
jgi:hypothetical protein